MLTTLRISGFAVVDQVEVHLGPGLNVLTGETGAGKSLLINALHLVLGGRTGSEVLREGAEEAVVEALFELPSGHPALVRLAEAGHAVPSQATDGATELLVRRVVPRGGRGRVFVNGALCTVAILEEAMRGVVDITGQHEHVSLLDARTHLPLLDAFAGVASAGGLRDRYAAAFRALEALAREDRALALDEGERARRADYLAFQLAELDQVDPAAGEDAALEQARKVLASAARLSDAARSAEALAYGEEGSASERIGQAVRALLEAVSVDPRLEGPLGLLRSAAAEVEEAGRELARYAGGLDADPDRLRDVDDRLAALRGVARKHGGSLAAAIARREEMRAELAALSGSGERRAELAEALAREATEAARLAAELTRERQGGARAFARAVATELEALGMARCRLEVALLPPEGGVEAGGVRLGPTGAETAEIRIAPNPGEPPRPIARVASGGELSRVLLALKRALARADPVACYVFDEVDAGVGGAVAEAVGRALAEVARDRQVVCVTHLPQVAAFADRHCRVEKRVAGGRTATAVVDLESLEDREGELARMLAGHTVTRSAVEHARSLLAGARAGVAGRARAAGMRPAARRAAVA
ncbi:MAG TPA: DNA repair protein RecN [Anaeromyxobacteraceae bacterium]|nr:DNA repair protein RecN [Anaeromyxobacteraceae bacterium]